MRTFYSYKAYEKEPPLSTEFSANRLQYSLDTYYGNSLGGNFYVTIAKRWLGSGLVDEVKGIAIQYPKGHPRYSPAGVMQIAEGFDFYSKKRITAPSGI